MHSTLKRQVTKHLGKGCTKHDVNSLLKAIDSTYQGYEEDRELLERSLEISSRELTEANEQLKKEVERVREQAEDMENTVKLMIGRELKMIELKKEIKRLRS